MKWAALHDAADAVAMLAGVRAEEPSAEIKAFPAAIRDAGEYRLQLAERAIGDMFSVLEAGLSALLAARARGVTAACPAQMLWQDFTDARAALLTLAPIRASGMGHRRIA